MSTCVSQPDIPVVTTCALPNTSSTTPTQPIPGVAAFIWSTTVEAPIPRCAPSEVPMATARAMSCEKWFVDCILAGALQRNMTNRPSRNYNRTFTPFQRPTSWHQRPGGIYFSRRSHHRPETNAVGVPREGRTGRGGAKSHWLKRSGQGRDRTADTWIFSFSKGVRWSSVRIYCLGVTRVSFGVCRLQSAVR